MKKLLTLILVCSFLGFGQVSDPVSKALDTYQNGIYHGTKTLRIYPTALGGIAFKNSAWMALSFGIVPLSTIPFISFETSNCIVSEPQFVFKLEQATYNQFGFLEADRIFRGAVSPHEFLLLQLTSDAKQHTRHLFKVQSGYTYRIKSKAIPFYFEETDLGVFDVYTYTTLAPGEYGFVHKDIMTTDNFTDFMVFDFRVAY